MQKTSRALHRETRGRIAAGEYCSPEVESPRQAISQTAREKLATPDGAVIAIPCSIETDAYRPSIPCLSFGQNRSYVSTMVLDGKLPSRGNLECMRCRDVLRMKIMNNHKLVSIHSVH